MNIDAYTYQASILCPNCAALAVVANNHLPVDTDALSEEILGQAAALLDVDRGDEYSFDSDDFPKVVFSHQIEQDESCETCGCDL